MGAWSKGFPTGQTSPSAGFGRFPRLRYDALVRFLIHGNLTPAVAEALKRHEHTAVPLADVMPAEATVEAILKLAHEKQLDIVTGDEALAHALYESEQKFIRSIVYLQLEGGDVEQDDAIDRLFERYKRLNGGRLYTVTATRVKVRQLPGGR